MSKADATFAECEVLERSSARLDAKISETENLVTEIKAFRSQLGLVDRIFRQHPAFDELRATKRHLRELRVLRNQNHQDVQQLRITRDAARSKRSLASRAISAIEKALAQSRQIQSERQATEDQLYLEREARKRQRDLERDAIVKQRAATKAARAEKQRMWEEQQKLEIQRLRAMAADVGGRARERADELKSALRAQNKIFPDCPYCFGPLGTDAELDHINPISRGGLSTKDNLVFVCRTCNQSKKGLTLSAFLKQRAVLRDRVEALLDKLKKCY